MHTGFCEAMTAMLERTGYSIADDCIRRSRKRLGKRRGRYDGGAKS